MIQLLRSKRALPNESQDIMQVNHQTDIIRYPQYFLPLTAAQPGGNSWGASKSG